MSSYKLFDFVQLVSGETTPNNWGIVLDTIDNEVIVVLTDKTKHIMNSDKLYPPAPNFRKDIKASKKVEPEKWVGYPSK